MRRGFDPIDRLSRFLSGGGLPAFALSLLLFYEILLLVLLLTPAQSSGLGAFAEDFRVWCFGFDAATGQVEWASVLAMTIPPALLGGFLALVFWQPLLEVIASPRSFARYASAAALVTLGAATGVGVVAAEPSVGDLPFPAEALRTAHRAPEIALTNQVGEPVELAALRGNVVALTAVYASCVHTCPAILSQAKRAIGELDADERRDLPVAVEKQEEVGVIDHTGLRIAPPGDTHLVEDALHLGRIAGQQLVERRREGVRLRQAGQDLGRIVRGVQRDGHDAQVALLVRVELADGPLRLRQNRRTGVDTGRVHRRQRDDVAAQRREIDGLAGLVGECELRCAVRRAERLRRKREVSDVGFGGDDPDARRRADDHERRNAGVASEAERAGDHLQERLPEDECEEPAEQGGRDRHRQHGGPLHLPGRRIEAEAPDAEVLRDGSEPAALGGRQQQNQEQDLVEQRQGQREGVKAASAEEAGDPVDGIEAAPHGLLRIANP
jgi:hypothetical protein